VYGCYIVAGVTTGPHVLYLIHFVLTDISDGYVNEDLSTAGVVTGMLSSH